MRIQVQEEDFNIAEVNRELCAGRSDVGAIASFIGLVRDMPQNRLQKMTLEHYPGMTEKSLIKTIENRAAALGNPRCCDYPSRRRFKTCRPDRAG